MQFEMNHKVGTDYVTVKLDDDPIKPSVVEVLISHFERIGGVSAQNVANWKFPVFITSQTIEEIIRNTCFVCGGLMTEGVAIQNGKIKVESYDSAIDTYQGEVEYTNPQDYKTIKVRKCTACGHSHT